MIKLIIMFRPLSGYFLAAWALFIAVFSSIPSLPVLKLHTQTSEIRLDYFIHVAEYGILAFLAYLTFSDKRFTIDARRYSIITICVTLFAFADEFHQKIIPGRSFNINDIYSNLAGILLSVVFCIFIFRRVAARMK